MFYVGSCDCTQASRKSLASETTFKKHYLRYKPYLKENPAIHHASRFILLELLIYVIQKVGEPYT